MICQFCGYEFADECGKYGCPNCLGEGLPDWLRELADTCPASDIADLNNTIDKS